MSPYEWLLQFLSSYIGGPNADALLNALADEYQKQQDLQIAVTDQLYISTSGGPYLDKVLAQYGIVRPGALGMADLAFSQMGITINARKMLPGVIHSVLDTFYGDDAVRAYTVSGQPEPYILQDGADLILQLENGVPMTILMEASAFADISQATAAEVAGVITQFFVSQNLLAYATVLTDQSTGKNYVKIYGGAMGPYSTITIDGGYVQDILEFAILRDTDLPSNTTVWQITRTVGSTIRFRWYSGPAPALENVITGDSVMIYGTQFVAAGFQGTFKVTNVRPPSAAPAYDSGWFEFNDPNVMGLASSQPNMAPPANNPPTYYSIVLAQAHYNDLKFYLPEKNTPYNQQRYALAWESDRNLLKVYLPATTQVVQRQLIGAAHMHCLYPDTNLDGSFGSVSNPAAQITVVNDYTISYPSSGHDNNGTGGTLDYTGAPVGGIPINYVSRVQDVTIVVCQVPHGILGNIQWQPGTAYTTGQQVFFSGLIYQATQASGPGHGGASDPSTYQKWESIGPGQNLSSTVVSVEVATVFADNPAEPFPGAYCVDPAAGYDLQGSFVETSQVIEQGARLQSLICNGVLPNTPGILLFGLGTDRQEGPVPYLGAQIATGPTVVPIMSVSQSGNTLDVTCSDPHGAVVGSIVTITGNSNSLLDGTFTVTSVPSLTTYVAYNPTAQTETGTGGQSSTAIAGESATLIMNPSYSFKYTHPAGEQVNLLTAAHAYVPNPNGTDYSFYLTGTAEALTFAEQLIRQITAAGINLEIIVVYPDDIGWGNQGDPTAGEPPLSDVATYIYTT